MLRMGKSFSNKDSTWRTRSKWAGSWKYIEQKEIKLPLTGYWRLESSWVDYDSINKVDKFPWHDRLHNMKWWQWQIEIETTLWNGGVMWYNDIIIWYIVWNNEPHQISDGWRSGMFEDTAAGQGGETESADWQTEEEYWEGVGQVRGHRQVVL